MKHLVLVLLLLMLSCPALADAQDLQAFAAAQYPGYTFVQGEEAEDRLCLLMRRPDGRQVVIGGVKDAQSGAYITQQSAAIPEGMRAELEYAMENHTFTLILRDKNGTRIAGCSLAPYGETWGVVMGDYTLGSFWVNISRAPNGAWCFGSHPWNDISAIDWENLPDTQEDVLAVMDTGDWATPNSPNYHDRVHLRAAPRKDAVSLGKYYNGTPVKVLGREEEWTHVSIFGVEGYMMTEYLAFGSDMPDADNGLYRVGVYGDSIEVYEWPEEDAQRTAVYPQRGVLLLAVVGEDWYHIWETDSGVSGYLPAAVVQPGNG